MDKGLLIPVVMVVVLLFGVSAQAELKDMHDGTIYDTDTQLSWLKNANTAGLMNWDQAVSWAASLNVGSGYAGLTGDCRQPTSRTRLQYSGDSYGCTVVKWGVCFIPHWVIHKDH